MDFTIKMSNWQNEGIEPSADLQANGFQSGQRPPASVFNWQWHNTSAAITELQERLSEVGEKAEESTGGTPIMDDSGILTWGEVDSDVDISIFSSYALKSKSENITLSASVWGNTAPYTYPISSANITATNVIEMTPSVSITADQLKALQKANIIGGTQTAGSIVLKAMGAKPTIDIPVTIIYRGDL